MKTVYRPREDRYETELSFFEHLLVIAIVGGVIVGIIQFMLGVGYSAIGATNNGCIARGKWKYVTVPQYVGCEFGKWMNE